MKPWFYLFIGGLLVALLSGIVQVGIIFVTGSLALLPLFCFWLLALIVGAIICGYTGIIVETR